MSDIKWSDLPRNGVVLVFGHRGGGKSALAWWLAERAHKERRVVAAYAMQQVAQKALPKWVRHTNSLSELANLKSSLIVVDEASLQAHARRSQSESNVVWTKMVAIARHKDHLVVFVAQHSRQLDVGLVSDADMVVLKSPSLLHLRFARPELRPELEQAFERFAKVRGEKRSRSYIVDYTSGKTAFLKNDLPSFWTEKLSRAFAAVDLGTKSKKPKRGTR